MSAVALVLVGGAVASPAAAGSQNGPASAEEEFIPFVTDFGRSAQPKEFIPFITDFGRTLSPPPNEIAPPAAVPAAAPNDALQWRGVAIGAGLGIGFAILVGGSWLAVRPRLQARHAAAAGARHQSGS